MSASSIDTNAMDSLIEIDPSVIVLSESDISDPTIKQKEMTSNLNTIVRDYISDTDLIQFEKKYLEEKKVGAVSETAQFEYGWCLIRSKYRDDVRKGVDIFKNICYNSSVDQRDYLFFIAIGYYKLSEFHIALKYVKRLLVIEPNNMQARELEKAIEEKMASHGMMGIALVGGAVALVGLFVSMVRK